jgi:AraC-like DNA-binding protein/ligand-binding sensor protein
MEAGTVSNTSRDGAMQMTANARHDRRLIDLVDHLDTSLLQRVMRVLQDWPMTAAIIWVLWDCESKLLVPQRRLPMYCRLIRQSKEGDQLCRKSDLDCIAEARRVGHGRLAYCHAGLMNIVVPMYSGRQYLGVAMGGAVRVANGTSREIDGRLGRIERLGIDPEEAALAYESVPVIPLPVLQEAMELVSHAAAMAASTRGNSKDERNLSEHSAPVDRAIEYALGNLSRQIHVGKLCREVLGLNPQYFARLFHARQGCSFSQYIVQLRMRMAEELIVNGMSIKQVSSQLGFSDPGYFARCFRLHHGVSPSLYKARRAQEQEP